MLTDKGPFGFVKTPKRGFYNCVTALILEFVLELMFGFYDGVDAFGQINNGCVNVRVRLYANESIRRACV